MNYSQKNLIIIPLIWFAISVALGQILCAATQPPEFILSVFSNYSEHIKEYEFFCMSMMILILFSPLSIFLLWSKAYKEFIPLADAGFPKWKIILFVALIVPFLIEMILALTGLGGEGRGDLRVLIILLFGWRGGVLTNTAFLTVVTIITMGFIKYVRRNKNV